MSPKEIDKLIAVCDRFRNSDDYSIAIETHKFKEFKKNEPKNPQKTKAIPFDDILEALKLSGYKEKLEVNERAEAELDKLLHQASQK